MKNKRGVIALVVAVLFGLFAARMVANYVKRDDEKPPPPRPVTKSPPPASAPALYGTSVPEGMRAVSIPVDEVTGVSHGVKHGDRVDVISVSNIPGKGGGQVSRLILQAVEVLAAAREGGTMDPGRTAGAARQVSKWVVTLLLTPSQAAVVTAADASGKLSLTVRNPQDLKPEQKMTSVVFTSAEGALPYVEPRQYAPIEDVRKLIKPGMRAFTLEAKVTDGAAGNIRPGDHVDVILTCPFGHFASSDHDAGAEGRITSTHMASRIFLQNLEVLAVADQERVVTRAKMPAPDGPAEPSSAALVQPETLKEKVKSIVLQVSPEDAELLTVATDATSKSIIRLLLRNPNDEVKVATSGQTPYRTAH